jgi:hypothetical protein
MMGIRQFVRKVKNFAVNYTKSFASILGGLIAIAISAVFEFHSLWQLDMICKGPVWASLQDNISWFQGMLISGYTYYSQIHFEDGPIYRGTVGGAYNFFLGMNAVGWATAIIGTFFIMYGITMFLSQKYQKIDK